MANVTDSALDIFRKVAHAGARMNDTIDGLFTIKSTLPAYESELIFDSHHWSLPTDLRMQQLQDRMDLTDGEKYGLWGVKVVSFATIEAAKNTAEYVLNRGRPRYKGDPCRAKVHIYGGCDDQYIYRLIQTRTKLEEFHPKELVNIIDRKSTLRNMLKSLRELEPDPVARLVRHAEIISELNPFKPGGERGGMGLLNTYAASDYFGISTDARQTVLAFRKPEPGCEDAAIKRMTIL